MIRPRGNNPSDLLKYADLGSRLAIVAALFTYGGFKLDQWLQTAPIFFIVGALFGMGLGMYSVVHAVDGFGKGPRGKAPPSDAEPPRDEPS